MSDPSAPISSADFWITPAEGWYSLPPCKPLMESDVSQKNSAYWISTLHLDEVTRPDGRTQLTSNCPSGICQPRRAWYAFSLGLAPNKTSPQDTDTKELSLIHISEPTRLLS